MSKTPDPIARNIETILRLEDAAMKRRTLADKVAGHIAGFVGNIAFVLLQLGLIVAWALINTSLVPFVPAFDPYPFPLLCMIVSMEGVFLAAFVLIKQNRMSYLSDRRSHVDLQINLLTEREVTHVLQLTERLLRHLGLEMSDGGSELAQETAVENLVHDLDAKLNQEV